MEFLPISRIFQYKLVLIYRYSSCRPAFPRSAMIKFPAYLIPLPGSADPDFREAALDSSHFIIFLRDLDNDALSSIIHLTPENHSLIVIKNLGQDTKPGLEKNSVRFGMRCHMQRMIRFRIQSLSLPVRTDQGKEEMRLNQVQTSKLHRHQHLPLAICRMINIIQKKAQKS